MNKVSSLVRRIICLIILRIVEWAEFAEAKESFKNHRIKGKFKYMGENSILPYELILKNPQYISIGKNFRALKNLRIEAWDRFAGEKFQPCIEIGENVIFNTDCHIGCIFKIKIGDNVLLASRIFISDHSHGDISKESLFLPPVQRPLKSKGPVIIEDNVWVGEGVSILPNVTIGKNSIIGANSVVTTSVPRNCVVAGVPAKIIKDFN
jgi:acetyltransferase-like isoleucine patch superfamily enzyme